MRVLSLDDNPEDRMLVTRELKRRFEGVGVEDILDAAAFTAALERGGLYR